MDGPALKLKTLGISAPLFFRRAKTADYQLKTGLIMSLQALSRRMLSLFFYLSRFAFISLRTREYIGFRHQDMKYIILIEKNLVNKLAHLWRISG